MKYLLDTNVISEVRKKHGDPRVKQWVAHQIAEELAISVVTVLEARMGIRQIARHDTAQAEVLERWLQSRVIGGFGDRILSLDVVTALRVADLHVPDRAPQHDAIIAGTALVHDLVLVTRNLKDFRDKGLRVFDPWERQP